MPTSPITINTLPSAPTTLDPTNFDLRADALLSALPQMVSQINSVALTTYSNAVQSENAAAAASVSGAPTWISGGTYALYDVTYSPANDKIYRCILAVSGSTLDPSINNTNWKYVSFEKPLYYVNVASYTCQIGVKYIVKYVSGPVALQGPATANDGDSFDIVLTNGFDNNTFNPSPYTFNGVAGVCTLDNIYTAIKVQFIDGGWRVSV